MNTNISAKRILIYGDSYVFGKNPGGGRYSSSERYTGKLQNILGDDFEIIEEGLRGRMLSGENGFYPHRDGLTQFDGIFGSHLPLDLIIIALGTNDCNRKGNLSASKVETSLDSYREKIAWWCKHLDFPTPKLLIIIPPIVDDKSATVEDDRFAGATAQSRELREHLTSYCASHNIDYLDLSKSINVSPIDGLHLDIENNLLLAHSLAKVIKEVL